MSAIVPIRVKTISEFHRFRGLPKPEHPLISVINLADIKLEVTAGPMRLMFDFYSIALKRNFHGKMKYGQCEYDFDEGVMTFVAPGQVFGIEIDKEPDVQQSGWMLLVHPDFFWNTPLAITIRQYEYFDYSVHEALFVSEKEELIIAGLMQQMKQEQNNNIDAFSQDIIIAQIELLLTYAERFYHRQFITRKKANHQMISRFETILADYFTSNDLIARGLPSVQYIADTLHVSAGYLSGLLKVLTGQSTQQHIHDKLLEKAKQLLTTTQMSVSEIAYQLGFEHPQSFNKLFKAKTTISPLAFRQSFN